MGDVLDRAKSGLLAEFDAWKQIGQTPRLFLRDDDAIDATCSLDKLYRMSEPHSIPILLAIIPKFACQNLATYIETHSLITPVTHGYAHTNHSAANAKKCEFGDERESEEMIGDLGEGLRLMAELFGNGVLPLFVPPWNRIGAKASALILHAGYTGISGFGWSKTDELPKRFNTHVDIIDWKNGKIGKSIATLLDELTAAFEISRTNGYTPIGLLTHHLVHDQWAWESLESLISIISKTDVIWTDPYGNQG